VFCSANESSSESLLLVAGWVRTDGIPGSFNGRKRQRDRKRKRERERERSRFVSERASEFKKQVHEAQKPSNEESNLAEEVGY